MHTVTVGHFWNLESDFRPHLSALTGVWRVETQVWEGPLLLVTCAGLPGASLVCMETNDCLTAFKLTGHRAFTTCLQSFVVYKPGLKYVDRAAPSD